MLTINEQMQVTSVADRKMKKDNMICTHVKKSSYSSKNLKNFINVFRTEYRLYYKSKVFVTNAIILSVLIQFTSYKNIQNGFKISQSCLVHMVSFILFDLFKCCSAIQTNSKISNFWHLFLETIKLYEHVFRISIFMLHPI